jgi:acyl-lipid omega-6 desaturase (Delta-12 desaturase)
VGRLLFDIMEHPAHHTDSMIPLYRLSAAQRDIESAAPPGGIVQRWTPAFFLHTLACCKLYDYERHAWLDFDGNVTSWVFPERMPSPDAVWGGL